MSKCVFVWLALILTAACATAQVTTDGSTTVNSFPYFKNSATQLSNSPITVNGSNVGIVPPTSTPGFPLDVEYNGGVTSGSHSLEWFGPGGPSATPGVLAGYYADGTNVTGGLIRAGGTGPGASVLFLGDAANNQALTISGSSIGIGTTPSSNYKLDVSGPIRSSSGGFVFPDGSSQTTAYSQQGVFQVGNGNINVPQALYVDSNLNGNAVYAPTAGVWIEWNNSSGMTDFINNEGGGSGGWAFINTDRNGTATGTPMVIQGGGNVGIGTTNPKAKLEVNGGLRFSADPSGTVQTTAWTGVLCGGDYAEAVDPVGEKQAYGPGDVLEITNGEKGDIQKSAQPYSTTVAGVFATKPGVVGRRQTLPDTGEEIPMAMVGIVPTKVTTENGPIHRGDLLVTSSRSGYAMKGTDRSRLVGAVIGKAMGALDSANGVIEVLVTLQ
jgi:hypothetical protein